MAEFYQYGGTGGGTYASHFTGKLIVTEESYSVANNTSYVYYELQLISGSSGRFSSAYASYSVTLDGSTVTSGDGYYNSQSYNTAQTICSGYATISHNSDGTKSLSCSAVLDFSYYQYSPGDFYPSGSFNLTTIPRASSVTATDANIGSASTISINRASSSFTHTLTYSFSGLTGTIATKTSSTSVGWTVPTSFFQKLPSSQSGTVTITCTTYSGNTNVGSKTTTMTVKVPLDGTYNSFPVIDSASAIDTNATTLALTGDSSRLVTYKSNVYVTATGRCINYATFSTLKSNNTNMTTSTSSSSGTTTVTGNITHNASDKTQFYIFLGDARGLYKQRYLNQANGDFTVVPYIPLTMNASVERVSSISDSINLSFSGNFYNGYYDASSQNFNNLTIKWRYKESTGNWITTGADDIINGWRNLTLGTDYQYTQNANTFSSINNITIANLFDYQKQYVIEIYYADELSSYTVSKDLSKGVPIYDAGVDSNGKNYLNVNGDIYCNNRKLVETKFLSSPLTYTNLTYTDTDIIKAKLIIVYFTHNYSGNGYRNSVVIPIEPVRTGATDTEWYEVASAEGRIGYIKIRLNDSQIITSQYANQYFAILGYSLIG